MIKSYLMLTLFYFIICSKGNYCFVELLFQLCVCIVTSNVFFTMSFGQRVHETLDCSARESGFDSGGHLSLPLSRLMTLRNCVCVCVFFKTAPTHTSAVSALRWSLFDFPFLHPKNYDCLLTLYIILPYLYYVSVLYLCWLLLSNPVSPHKHASPPSALDFSFALFIALGSLAPIVHTEKQGILPTGSNCSFSSLWPQFTWFTLCSALGGRWRTT